MRRREFIVGLGGVVAARPLDARAQQGDRMRRIGVLSQRLANDPEWQARMTAFRQTLQELGWIEGRTIHIEHRVGLDDGEFLRRSAAELVALAPDVILVNGNSPLTPLLQATRQVPIVFVNVVPSARVWSQASLGQAVTPPDLPCPSLA